MMFLLLLMVFLLYLMFLLLLLILFNISVEFDRNVDVLFVVVVVALCFAIFLIHFQGKNFAVFLPDFFENLQLQIYTSIY